MKKILKWMGIVLAALLGLLLVAGVILYFSGSARLNKVYDIPPTGLTLPKGLGTRHWTAAAITNVTNALAVVVSQSTGAVRLFQEGEVILRIAPMRHARAMKWIEEEVEHAPARPDKSS